MRAVRAWIVRLLGFLSRDRRDREFAEELEANIEMHIADNMRSGMTREEARRQALIRLGGVQQTRDSYRDRLTLPSLETALQDVRGGIRLMRRSPGFTAVALLTLALGIGANAVMFSIVNTVLLRPLPYPASEELFYLQTMGAAGQPWATSPPDFYTYRSRTRTLRSLEAYYTRPFNLTGGPEPERLPAMIVAAGFFRTLGVHPALGRDFASDDEIWGAHRVAVLTDGLWRRRFAGDPRVIGQPIVLNATSYEVIGILPRSFSFLASEAQLFVPMAFAPGDNMNSHSNYFLNMVGRLNTNVPLSAAHTELNQICQDIIREHPENAGTSIEVRPLHDEFVRDVQRPMIVLLGAVGFVLLTSCANLANLLLARGAVRQREIALRTAIGATRTRLLRQLLTESLVLSITGGLAGLLLVYLSVDTLNLLSLDVLPRAEDIRIDGTVLAFTFLAATLTGILFGLVPALKSSAANLNEDLKEGVRTASQGAGPHRLRAVLVVAEVSLSLVLLIGAGLMVKSMHRLLNVESGFSTDGVLTMQINLPPEKYVDQRLERQFSPLAYTRSIRFFSELMDRVRSIPGVRAAGAITGLPLMGENWGKRITFFDRPLPADVNSLQPIQYRVVVGDYFRALGIRITSGRAFTDQDTADAAKVVIVNRELVRRHWNDEDVIGKIVSVNPPVQLLPKSVIEEARAAGLPADYAPDRFTVIGVADDVRYSGLNVAAVPVVYAPYAQGSEGSTNMYVTIRTDGDPLNIVSAVREQVWQVDRDQPIASIRTMEDRVAASVAQPRLEMIVLTMFAALAVLLAAIGIYGVTSYSVTQRNREIGIRVALGAERSQVFSLILRHAARLVVLGLSLGVVGALLVTRVMRTLLFEVSPTDPAVFSAFAVGLALTACAAACVPARRATRVDPIVTLRYE